MAAGRANVQNRTLVLTDWWGSGIVHAKVWIANKKDAYIGSANNDWKSLTQVNIIDTTFLGGELVKAHLAKTRVLSKNWLKLWPLYFLLTSGFCRTSPGFFGCRSWGVSTHDARKHEFAWDFSYPLEISNRNSRQGGFFHADCCGWPLVIWPCHHLAIASNVNFLSISLQFLTAALYWECNSKNFESTVSLVSYFMDYWLPLSVTSVVLNIDSYKGVLLVDIYSCR